MRIVLAVVAALACACGGPRYTYRWSSPEGQACVSRCQSGYYGCRSQCKGWPACMDDCASSEHFCAAACPDVVVERVPEPDYNRPKPVP